MIVKRHLIKSVLLGTIASAIVTLGAVFVSTGTARADGEAMHNPASGTLNANCAGCHRIHTAVGASLLRQTDVVALCKTCHGSGGTGSDLNVDGGTGAGGGALRGGGFEATLIDTADPVGRRDVSSSSMVHIGVRGSTPTTSTHDVGGTNLPIWGNSSGGWSTSLATFTCANCHDPHGGSDDGKPTYRILRVVPTGSDASIDAVVTDEATGLRHYTTTDYYNPYVGLTNPAGGTTGNQNPLLNVQAMGGISAWCAQCHKAYIQTSFPDEETPNGAVGNYAGKYMHQASDVNISHSTGLPALASRTCVKCHVAHGTSAAMSDATFTTAAKGLAYPDGSVGGGDSRLLKADGRGICRKCHSDK